MDPVTLIVTALAVGAAKGVGDAAASAVGDLYRQLKSAVAKRLGGSEDVTVALGASEAEAMAEAEAEAEVPVGAVATTGGGATGALMKALTDHDVAADPAVVALAGRLLELADPEGAAAGRYSVTVVGSQGVQIGNHNLQQNTFGS